MRPRTIALALLCLGFAFGGWVLARPPVPAPRQEIVLVADLSLTAIPTALCDDLLASFQAARRENARRENTVVGLRLFSTGTAVSGQEPSRQGPWEQAPERRLLHGSKAQDPLAVHLSTACSALEPTTETPLFRAILAALGELSVAVRGRPERSGFLLVRSDLLEEEDKILLRRVAKPSLPEDPRLDNTGIAVTFCGVTQRRVKPKSRLPSAAALQAAWRAEFHEPSTVSFHSGCP